MGRGGERERGGVNHQVSNFGRGPETDGAGSSPRPEPRDTGMAAPANLIERHEHMGCWTARPRELADDIGAIASGPFSLDKNDPALLIRRRTYFLLEWWVGIPALAVVAKPERYERAYETTWRRLAL